MEKNQDAKCDKCGSTQKTCLSSHDMQHDFIRCADCGNVLDIVKNKDNDHDRRIKSKLRCLRLREDNHHP